MSDETRVVVAVPSNGAGGLDAERAGHFGHCDCFTVVEVREGGERAVRIVENPPHIEGGCLRPVGLLAAEGVNAIIVAGIGGRPLAGFTEAGIAVYFDREHALVGDVLDAFSAGSLELMDAGSACKGH